MKFKNIPYMNLLWLCSITLIFSHIEVVILPYIYKYITNCILDPPFERPIWGSNSSVNALHIILGLGGITGGMDGKLLSHTNPQATFQGTSSIMFKSAF